MLKYLKWFSTYWKKTPLTLLVVAFLTILTTMTRIGYPLFLKFVIDELSSGQEIDNAYKLIFWLLCFGIGKQVLWVMLPLFRGTLNNIYTAWIRNEYFKKLTNKTNKFFIKFKTGDLITRLTDDLDGSWVRICWYSCSGIFRPLEAFLILGFSVGIMFTYSVELTLYTFLPLPILVFIMHKLDEKILSYTDKKQKSISKCNNVLESSFAGIKIVKTTLSEKYQFKQYEDAIDDRIEKEKKFLLINQLVHFFTMLVNHMGTVVVIFIGGLYVSQGKITIGTLLMFIMYLNKLIEPIWTLSFFWASSKQIFQYVERVMQIDEKECVLKDGEFGEKIDKFETLELKNIFYQYDNTNKNIIINLNLSIKRGEKIALLGAVGSGKTTILEMIAMNLVPNEGEILVNGINQNQISRNSFSQKIGYVRQENILFSESIRQNIILGDDFSEDAISAAIKNSLMDKEINSFKDKLSTVVGEKGTLLSGGQRQRLALARTLIRKPELILMDDCTAAMDSQTESDFWENFNNEYLECACLIVTHRLSTAKKADRIYFLNNNGITMLDSNHNLDDIYQVDTIL